MPSGRFAEQYGSAADSAPLAALAWACDRYDHPLPAVPADPEAMMRGLRTVATAFVGALTALQAFVPPFTGMVPHP